MSAAAPAAARRRRRLRPGPRLMVAELARGRGCREVFAIGAAVDFTDSGEPAVPESARTLPGQSLSRLEGSESGWSESGSPGALTAVTATSKVRQLEILIPPKYCKDSLPVKGPRVSEGKRVRLGGRSKKGERDLFSLLRATPFCINQNSKVIRDVLSKLAIS